MSIKTRKLACMKKRYSSDRSACERKQASGGKQKLKTTHNLLIPGGSMKGRMKSPSPPSVLYTTSNFSTNEYRITPEAGKEKRNEMKE
jgi:hypothetical protein